MSHKHYMKEEPKKKSIEKDCKVCSKRFKPFRTTQTVCSAKCAKKYARAKINNEKRIERERIKKLKDELKPYSKLMGEAKAAFQKWVRLRDKDKPCISCGKLEAEQWDGSHYFKSEIYRGVIFHPWNVNKACSYCNRWLDGNLIPYREELIKRIGLEKVKLLELEAKQTQQRKWTRTELVEIRDEHKQKIKLMK